MCMGEHPWLEGDFGDTAVVAKGTSAGDELEPRPLEHRSPRALALHAEKQKGLASLRDLSVSWWSLGGSNP